jgi:hypothetical protein
MILKVAVPGFSGRCVTLVCVSAQPARCSANIPVLAEVQPSVRRSLDQPCASRPCEGQVIDDGAGFAAADRPRILEALSALAPHLSGWEHDRVDLEVSLKDTEGPDQKLTLQAWLAGRAHLIATSHERDLDHALTEVRRDLIRQIEDERSRREPRKRRKTRYRAT